MKPSVGMQPWRKCAERSILDTRIFRVLQRAMQSGDGSKEGEFYALNCPDWALCVPVTDDGRLLLVRQFRYGIESFGWEVPGGVLHVGEDPVAGAARELEEETGYQAVDYALLGASRPNPAIQTNTCHFVLAKGVTPSGQPNWDEHEELEARLFSGPEVSNMIAAGAIHHALCLNAIFLYERLIGRQVGGKSYGK